LPAADAAAASPVSRAAELARRVSHFAVRQDSMAVDPVPDIKPTCDEVAVRPAERAIAEIIETARGLPDTAAPDPDTLPMVDQSNAAIATMPALAAPPAIDRTGVQHLYGVRKTTRGMLFVQPGDCGKHVCLAGDFNDWSAHATPMRRNDELKVLEAIVPLPPGRYQYRLVIDGRWTPDAHNELRLINSYGELNSVVEVR
jgi:hypothetical protein